jgi:hypothetical protein
MCVTTSYITIFCEKDSNPFHEFTRITKHFKHYRNYIKILGPSNNHYCCQGRATRRGLHPVHVTARHHLQVRFLGANHMYPTIRFFFFGKSHCSCYLSLNVFFLPNIYFDIVLVNLSCTIAIYIYLYLYLL